MTLGDRQMTFKPGDVVIHKASGQRAVVLNMEDIEVAYSSEGLRQQDVYLLTTAFEDFFDGALNGRLFPGYVLELDKPRES